MGFVNKRPYLIPHFFEDKPVDRLLGPGYEAAHFNDDRLGRRVFEVLDYRPARGHLDTTNLSVHGQYNSESREVSGLHITQGYSKDKRPDLPKVTLQLICEHLSVIPMHMEALNGNSSDSESFRNAILNFGKQFHSEEGLVTIVADSLSFSTSLRPKSRSNMPNGIRRENQRKRPQPDGFSSYLWESMNLFCLTGKN